MKLSNNFSLKEMTKSQTALRRGIDNEPGEEEQANLQQLCEQVLQKVREHFGKPVTVNSGYRSPELNKAIGGSTTSDHCKGMAADIEIPGVSNINFLKTAINEKRERNGLDPITAKDYMNLVREKSKLVELSAKLTSRSVNEGFSGGEKKRNEIFQMAMLEPSLSILDDVVFLDPSSQSFTVFLPSAVGTGGKKLYLKRKIGTHNVIVRAQTNETIDGQNTRNMVYDHEALTFVSDNTNWYII